MTPILRKNSRSSSSSSSRMPCKRLPLKASFLCFTTIWFVLNHITSFWLLTKSQTKFTAVTSTGEDIKLAMKNAYNFKQATPHAPSCDLPLNISTISFTLVMQLSADRVWMLPYHCDRWGHDHPISVVIFSDSDADSMKEKVMLQGCSAQQLTVQTVKKSKFDPKGTDYPVNILRNLALSVVKTSHVVYVDVDFWPASNLYSTLSQMKVKGRFTSDPYLAVVIPAFQMNRQCQEMKDCREASIPAMPVDKASLFALLKTRNAAFFDYRNYGGHSSTKYHTWKDQEAGAFVDLPCIRSNRYEPYLAIRYCSDLPPFQEWFTGYSKNKMTWVMQLRRRGYLFSQLGGTFLIHYPHMHSKSRKEFDKRPNLTDADVMKESTPDESEHPLNLHKKSKDNLQDETKQGRLQKERKQDFHQGNMKMGSHQESTKQQTNQIIVKHQFVKSNSNNTKWSSQQKQNKKQKFTMHVN